MIKSENKKKENTICHNKCRLIMAYNYYDKAFLKKCIQECDNKRSHRTHT